MHIAGASYDEVIRSFRWELPQSFNIAEAICEQHARSAPGATALIYEDAGGHALGVQSALGIAGCAGAEPDRRRPSPPSEVEECLAKHPAVALAGVIGSPDPIRGEVVAAFIVPRAGFAPTRELAAEIQDFVKSRLGRTNTPQGALFSRACR